MNTIKSSLVELHKVTMQLHSDCVKLPLIAGVRDELVRNGIPHHHANILTVGSEIQIPSDVTKEELPEIIEAIARLFTTVYHKYDARGLISDDTVRLLAPQLQVSL